MKKYSAVLFDLDGTFIDTSPGIYNGIDYMLPRMGMDLISEEEKVKFIGPPLTESYTNFLGLSGDKLIDAISLYRKYCVKQGYKEYKDYPGTDKLLKTLKENNIITGIVTMKKQDIAEQCVNETDYGNELTFVLGNNTMETMSKAELIESVLDKYNLDKDEVLLIGDTDVDARGAYEAGIDFYPALYGFGYSHSDFKEKYPYQNKLNSPLELLKYMKL